MTTRTFDNVSRFATHAIIHAAIERYRLSTCSDTARVEARDAIVSGYTRDVRYGLGGLRPFASPALAPDKVAGEVADLYPEWLAMATEYFGLTLDELGHIFGSVVDLFDDGDRYGPTGADAAAAVRDAVTSAVTRTILFS